MWNNGIAFKQQTSCRSCKHAARTARLEVKDPATRGTPFGLDVVPGYVATKQRHQLSIHICTMSPHLLASASLLDGNRPGQSCTPHIDIRHFFQSSFKAWCTLVSESENNVLLELFQCTDHIRLAAFGPNGAAHTWPELASMAIAAVALRRGRVDNDILRRCNAQQSHIASASYESQQPTIG